MRARKGQTDLLSLDFQSVLDYCQCQGPTRVSVLHRVGLPGNKASLSKSQRLREEAGSIWNPSKGTALHKNARTTEKSTPSRRRCSLALPASVKGQVSHICLQAPAGPVLGSPVALGLPGAPLLDVWLPVSPLFILLPSLLSFVSVFLALSRSFSLSPYPLPPPSQGPLSSPPVLCCPRVAQSGKAAPPGPHPFRAPRT